MKKLVICVGLTIILLFSSCTDEKYTTKIVNAELFISEGYANEELLDDWWITHPGQAASKNFFPEYEDISYDYSEVQFYVWSNASPFRYIHTSFVLELKFDNEANYEEAKTDVYSQYQFLDDKVKEDFGRVVMPSHEFYINDYFAKVVTDGDDAFPNYCSAICTNDENCTIRYLYWFDHDRDVLRSSEELIKSIISGTSCEW